MQLGFYPFTGQADQRDPVLSVLNNVRCTGATHGTGHQRPHQDPDRPDRDVRRPRSGDRRTGWRVMKKRGCNIRLVYAMFGRQALQVLRHEAGPGGVPMTHLAYDADCNGIYDKYVHMKSMTVSGVYGKNTHARITWNGSANWTPVSLASDEVVGRLAAGGTTSDVLELDRLPVHARAGGVAAPPLRQGLATVARARLPPATWTRTP